MNRETSNDKTVSAQIKSFLPGSNNEQDIKIVNS